MNILAGHAATEPADRTDWIYPYYSCELREITGHVCK